MPNFGYNDLLVGISDYLRNGLDFADEFRYIGPLPAISSTTDYENFANGLFPLLGAAITIDNLEMQMSQGVTFPVIEAQIIYCFKSPPSRTGDTVIDYLEKLTALRDFLLATSRGDLFGMSADILAMRVQRMYSFPSFMAKVEGNKKAFNIGYFQLLLETSAI